MSKEKKNGMNTLGIYSDYADYYHNELLNNPNSKIALDYLKKEKSIIQLLKNLRLDLLTLIQVFMKN